MLSELKQRRAMPTLAISAFVDTCNQILRQLNLAEEESRDVTPRTVRFYTQEGLLPAPLYEGGRARYGYEHLLRVLAIKVYQSQFHPLRMIRERLVGESKSVLERLITEAVSSSSGEFLMHASAFPTSQRVPFGPREPYAMVPGIPPEVPVNPPEVPRVHLPPVPTVYERDSERVEYMVLVRGSLEEATLEADLNAIGREGWYLVQILVHEGKVLLVLMRRRPGRK